MPSNFILETERLGLREFTLDDAPAFAALLCNPQVMQFIAPCFTSQEDATNHLKERALADYRKHGFGRWAMVSKQDGAVIGFAGLKYLDDLQEVDLGFGLLPEHWGRGLAVEAGQALLAYGFNQLRLKRILGLVDPQNARSIRALTKLGFIFEKSIEYHSLPTTQYVRTAS
jgi:ribosomal-protein-alanine N-acetyltransferase